MRSEDRVSGSNQPGRSTRQDPLVLPGDGCWSRGSPTQTTPTEPVRHNTLPTPDAGPDTGVSVAEGGTLGHEPRCDTCRTRDRAGKHVTCRGASVIRVAARYINWDGARQRDKKTGCLYCCRGEEATQMKPYNGVGLGHVSVMVCVSVCVVSGAAIARVEVGKRPVPTKLTQEFPLPKPK